MGNKLTGPDRQGLSLNKRRTDFENHWSTSFCNTRGNKEEQLKIQECILMTILLSISLLIILAKTFRDSEDDKEEQVDVATEEVALKNIQEQLQGREKELIEELPDNSPPGAILANSLIADLHRDLPDLLDAMLGNLLAEAPDIGRLHYILEHINYWIVSRVSQERARAIRSSTALLRFIITLPEFDNSAELPRTGHHVAQLALFMCDPARDSSQQAREGYLLYQLLLHQRGLTIHEAEDLWCCNWHQDSRLLGYKNTARGGELTVVCNLSFKSASVPDDWRIANMTPMFKKGSRDSPGTLRLTSV
ncbi:hypothetical protein UY3_11696 [Chelonia mydas]|uniref:Maestro-like HEAT-repeats domain-containing protein n=1 Tax=Chelonia mydas TaxID=8469 RepID=M7B022_CHEMY|nr:hypothetical protein UY3_11696 [Chelonia mydas]